MSGEGSTPATGDGERPERHELFISYSRHNKDFLDDFKDHLNHLENTCGLKIWYDSRIQPGDNWREEIENALARAKVALLLVSQKFLVSDFIRKKELPSLLRSAENNGLKILWVPLSPCRWKSDPIISRYQSILKDPTKSLAEREGAEKDLAMVEIADRIESTFLGIIEEQLTRQDLEAKSPLPQYQEEEQQLAEAELRHQSEELARLERLKEASEARVEAERLRTEAETLRAEVEQLRIELEQSRAAAEQFHAEAELPHQSEELARLERLKAESEGRAEVEWLRAEAEKLRAEVERSRIELEQSRAAAEQSHAEAELQHQNEELARLERLKAESEARAEVERLLAEAEKLRAEVEASRIELEQSRAAAEQSKAEVKRLAKEKEEWQGKAKALIEIRTNRGWLVQEGKEWKKKEEAITVSGYREQLAEGIAITMLRIPEGEFLMGSPESEVGFGNERPQHRVTLGSFFLGQTPVTQAQWKVVAGFPKLELELPPNPFAFQGAKLPVERVSWEEAMEFCRRLSQHTGKNYTLPNEAQWEYACRAGTTTPFAFGNTLTSEIANYDATYTYGSGPKGDYREKTTAVDSFPANAWGLQDMHGNVWEWCLDAWHDTYQGAPTDGSAWMTGGEGKRLLRGGSWGGLPVFCRSAGRGGGLPGFRYRSVGCRLCCLPQDLFLYT